VTSLVKRRNSNCPVKPIELLAWAHAMSGDSSLFITFCLFCLLCTYGEGPKNNDLAWKCLGAHLDYHHRVATKQIKWGRLANSKFKSLENIYFKFHETFRVV